MVEGVAAHGLSPATPSVSPLLAAIHLPRSRGRSTSSTGPNTCTNAAFSAASASSKVTGRPKIDQAGHPVFGHPAGHDAVEMGEVRFDIEADTVERHPVSQFHPDGGDLVLAREKPRPLAFDPDADPALP